MSPFPPAPSWPIPIFVLDTENINHEGTKLFFSNFQLYDDFKAIVLSSCTILYTPETVPRKVKEIKLILRQMPGVAHTCGSDTHKEIHFSLDWIKTNAHRARDEIMGVLTHEVVHCFQYDAQGTCPGGLIEGIADFVRLKADLAPPHWRINPPTPAQTWDSGYETTAYFLDWMTTTYGSHIVRFLNLSFRDRSYHRRVFRELTGRPVRKLWALYRGTFISVLGGCLRTYTPEPPADSESEDEGFDWVDTRGTRTLSTIHSGGPAPPAAVHT